MHVKIHQKNEVEQEVAFRNKRQSDAFQSLGSSCGMPSVHGWLYYVALALQPFVFVENSVFYHNMR